MLLHFPDMSRDENIWGGSKQQELSPHWNLPLLHTWMCLAGHGDGSCLFFSQAHSLMTAKALQRSHQSTEMKCMNTAGGE